MDVKPNYAVFYSSGLLHKCTYDERPTVRKDGSISLYKNVWTLCQSSIGIPHPGKDGKLITGYESGNPFPMIFEEEPSGYPWCPRCRRVMEGKKW